MRQTVKTYIARLLVVVLVGIMLSATYLPASVSAAESGNCGASLTWRFAAGTLTISGEGVMKDYYDGVLPPWHHLAGEITKIVLPEGLTAIGRLAFFNCTALKTVSIPDSVRTIRPKAFYNCQQLKFIDLSDTLSTIGEEAFYGCRSLTAVTLPATVQEIGPKAFYLCESIVTLTIPQSAEKLGHEAFAYCTSLMRAKILAPIQTVPAWMFYGCSSLVEIEMPTTVSQVDAFAFRNCEDLVHVYHNGQEETVENIRQELAQELPQFTAGGYVGSGVMSDTTSNSRVEEGDVDSVIIAQTSTKVHVSQNLIVTTEVTLHSPEENKDSKYQTEISLIVTDDNDWQEAKQEVDKALRAVNQDYAPLGKEESTKVIVFVSNAATVNADFVKSMAGRKVETEIVTAEGSAWSLDCEKLKAEDVSDTVDYSYKVDEIDEENLSKLGSQDGYRVSFNESAKINSQIKIQLPSDTAGKNAFLYQVENDGSHTRLQAVEVDKSGTAHFYLAAVDKNTDYIIGMNVPGEKTDDVIVSPDRATQNAIQRVEQIEYVTTGARTMHGITLSGMILIVLGILVVVAIVVGVIMTMYNKSKMKNYPYMEK